MSDASDGVVSRAQAVRFDAGRPARPEIGFVLLATEQTVQDDMVRVAPEYILEFATRVDRGGADAVFVSCGALRTLDVVQQIEERRGKPVVCSNQAMMWDCLRLAGIADRVPGYGSLLAGY